MTDNSYLCNLVLVNIFILQSYRVTEMFKYKFYIYLCVVYSDPGMYVCLYITFN